MSDLPWPDCMHRTKAETGAGLSCKGYGAALAQTERLRDREEYLLDLLTEREADIKYLRGLLYRYGKHENGCPLHPEATGHLCECLCGLDAALCTAALKPVAARLGALQELTRLSEELGMYSDSPKPSGPEPDAGKVEGGAT